MSPLPDPPNSSSWVQVSLKTPSPPKTVQCLSICSIFGQRAPQRNYLVHAEPAPSAASARAICKLHWKTLSRGRDLEQPLSRQSLSLLAGSPPYPPGACPGLQGLSLYLSDVAVHTPPGTERWTRGLVSRSHYPVNIGLESTQPPCMPGCVRSDGTRSWGTGSSVGEQMCLHSAGGGMSGLCKAALPISGLSGHPKHPQISPSCSLSSFLFDKGISDMY